MTDYLIRGADVLGRGVADIGVHHGRIVDPELLAAGETEVVDAAGLVALPGLVDMHTHLREPGKEDAETVLTGCRAAAAGGYTCVHAMTNTAPVADTAGEIGRASGRGRG